MEQDDRDVLEPSEGLQGGEAPAATLAGDVAGAEEGEQERVSETENSVRGAAWEGPKKQDLEEPSPESGEVPEASGRVEIEEHQSLGNPAAIAAHFEFRSAAADMTPPPTASLRARSRDGKQAGPPRLASARDAERAGSEAAVIAASSFSAPATGTHANVPAMADGDQGVVPGYDRKLKRDCSVPGTRVAIAHASPPDSYRHVPWRSRKQYCPKRFLTAAGASPSAAAPPAVDPPAPAASMNSALPSASASGLRAASTGITDASASSSSNRPPSRGRKLPRPEHFIPEEAEASASAKARRIDIVLDRFLSSLVHGSSASEWVSNVAAEDATVRGQQHSTVEGFRIRDASRHAARALSHLGCASPSPSGAAGSPRGEPDGRGKIYGVLAVLGGSLALTVVTCVLFYIVGQRSEPGTPGQKPDE